MNRYSHQSQLTLKVLIATVANDFFFFFLVFFRENKQMYPMKGQALSSLKKKKKKSKFLSAAVVISTIRINQFHVNLGADSEGSEVGVQTDSKLHFHGKFWINMKIRDTIFTLNIHTPYSLPYTSLQ